GAALRGCASVPTRDLDRRRHARRVSPRSRRRGVPARARGDRRDGRPFRAVRRDARADRVPLSARPRVPRGPTYAAVTTRASNASFAEAITITRHGAFFRTASPVRPKTNARLPSGRLRGAESTISSQLVA